MNTFTIYGKDNCNFCSRAKRLLDLKGMEYVEMKIPDQVDVDTLKERVKEADPSAVVKSVPQVFCGEQYVGGYNELRDFLAA